jgi:hypothetical protein
MVPPTQSTQQQAGARHRRQRHRLTSEHNSKKSPTHHSFITKHKTTLESKISHDQACFSASPSVTSVLGQKWLRSPTGKSMPNLISAAIITNVMYQLRGKNNVHVSEWAPIVGLRALATLTLI